MNKVKPDEETTSATDEEFDSDKVKKSWSLMNVQKHKHPYEDKDGWVSLDPVPWSVSKISKWQNKPKPTEKPWNSKYHNSYTSSNNRPWVDYDSVDNTANSYQYSTSRPFMDKKKYQVYIVDDHKENIKPIYSKPSNIYVQANPTHQPFHSHHYHEEPCNHNLRDDGIITDGLEPNFPSRNFEFNRRQGTQMVQDKHPFMGDGDWVLLSTTKGYKRPKSKQRSLDVQHGAIGRF